KEYQIVVDPARLHAHKMTLGELTDALAHANVNVGGGYIERQGESLTLRGVGRLGNEDEVANVVVRTNDDGTPGLGRHIRTVRVGAAMRFGVITRDGQSEAVTGITMMLIGANSRDVVQGVKKKVAEIQALLPPGVFIEPIYDRAEFLGRTLHTVAKNLVEG